MNKILADLVGVARRHLRTAKSKYRENEGLHSTCVCFYFSDLISCERKPFVPGREAALKPLAWRC